MAPPRTDLELDEAPVLGPDAQERTAAAAAAAAAAATAAEAAGGGSTSTSSSGKVQHQQSPPAPALFHLGFRLPDDAAMLRTRFRDVKFVLLCGSANRAAHLAQTFLDTHHHSRRDTDSNTGQNGHDRPPPPTAPAPNLCTTDRYTLFQPHPALLTASHGIGKGSADILFHEITSTLRAAGAHGFSYIRVGSSGGCATAAGTLVVSDSVVDETGAPVVRSFVLGQLRDYPAQLDRNLAHQLADAAREMYGPENVRTGTTMCCETFYEAQGRLDGAYAEYTPQDRIRFLERCRDAGVINFEMESVVLAAFCTRLDIPVAVICAVLVDRLDGISDTPHAPPVKLSEWEQRPIRVVTNFVSQKLKALADQQALYR